MNLTLAVDERTVERAREAAQKMGKSLNGLIREYIDQLAGDRTGEQLAAEWRAMWAEWDRYYAAHPELHRSEPITWKREEIYAERLNRYKP
ncbi:MAG TPA: DUF6364 family protein [Kofleriaceae bacterium]|jgi:hypothetical protein